MVQSNSLRRLFWKLAVFVPVSVCACSGEPEGVPTSGVAGSGPAGSAGTSTSTAGTGTSSGASSGGSAVAGSSGGSTSAGSTGVAGGTPSAGNAGASSGGTGGSGGSATGGGGAAGSGGGSAGSGPCTTPPVAEAVKGWASVSGMNTLTTTGGGNATPQVVTTLEAFKAAVGGTNAAVVYLNAKLAPASVAIGSNKTIVGVCGAEFHGHLGLSKSVNVIVRRHAGAQQRLHRHQRHHHRQRHGLHPAVRLHA